MEETDPIQALLGALSQDLSRHGPYPVEVSIVHESLYEKRRDKLVFLCSQKLYGLECQ